MHFGQKKNNYGKRRSKINIKILQISMKQIWKGKLKLRIKKENPYYGTGYRHLEKVLFYKCGWSISLWTIHPDSCIGQYSDWAKEHLRKIFPDATFEDNKICYYYNGKHKIIGEPPKWLFNTKCKFVPTNNDQVFFETRKKKYIGFSHRGCCSFGIGDMLFTGDIKDFSHYYKIPKYRWMYIKTLLKYHIKGDSMMFQDICEDNIIGHGISQVIPFKEKGIKKIETLDEAYQAACNFAKYIS